jgi:hypothetical protein
VISFRYHLVSVIAVFLALAVGIVVGTAVLNGPVTKDLRHQVSSLKHQRGQLDAELDSAHGQIADAGRFTSTFGPQLVGGTLEGTPVLIVGLPGVSSGMEDGIATLLTAAGAKLTGRLDLARDYVDQSEATKLSTFLTSAHPIGLRLTETSDARVLGAETLAWVLTGNGKQTDLKTVLDGLASLHMIDSDTGSVQAAKTVVVVGSGTLAKRAYAGPAELDLINALQERGGTVVVAGDRGSARGAGVVGLVRSGTAKSVVSTVDNADTPYGRVSTVLALAQAADSQVGQYGTAAGADAPFPRPGS